MLLHRMSKSVQQIANAIATALESNVTIVDNNLVRIAGTGPYFKKIKEKVPKKSVFAQVLKDKATIVIEHPGKDTYCLGCALSRNCVETYEICTPIIWQEKVVGVIAIFAFDQQQRDVMIAKKEQYLNFLKNMSDLIASKVGEYKLFEDVNTYNKELDIIIQNVNQGVLCVNNNGQLKYINQKACSLLALPWLAANFSGLNLRDIWPQSIVLQALTEEREFYDHQEYYSIKEHKKNFLSTVRLIQKEAQVIGAVKIFTDLEKMQRSVYRITSSGSWSFDHIIGSSEKIKENKRKARQVAGHDSTVLIIGESGTGKEVFARAIHQASARADYPFIAINCSAIPETLLESELFGYATGAFTGASKKGKLGKFELAHQGTIFLDEIGDMPLFLQAKLLRVLQEKKITRVGGVKMTTVDVRVIAATNQNIEELIAKKMFRKDLYYRINVIPLHLSPLRERTSDLRVLVDHFLGIYNRRFQKKIIGFTAEAMKFLLAYDWPGNVRELENVIEYGINFCRGNYIGLADIEGRFKPLFREEDYNSLKELVQKYEREVVIKLLNQYGWDEEGKERAAERLAISRATLYRKLSQN